MGTKVSLKSKIQLKDMGSPKKLGALDETIRQLKLGTVLGIASDIIRRTMPNGDVFEGLGGSFECVSEDANTDTIQSGILYLPAGVYEAVANPLKEMEPVLDADGKAKNDSDGNPVLKRKTASVSFAFEVFVIRADNPQGYSWKFTPLGQDAGSVRPVDPLSELRLLMAGPAQAALPKPEAAKEPETVGAAKGKK